MSNPSFQRLIAHLENFSGDPSARKNGKPRPIAFPPRAEVNALCRTRANVDNTLWQQQVERREALMHAARQDGYDLGERIGYMAGWRWGVLCGAIAGAMFAATTLLAIQYLPAMLAAWFA